MTPGQVYGGFGPLCLHILPESHKLFMAKPLSDLIKAVSKEPEERTLTYKGEEYSYFATPLTLGERDRVRKLVRNEDDATEYALRLLIAKAKKKDGSRMFQDGQYVELKNDWPSVELEKAMLKLMQPDEQVEEEEEGKD